MLPDAAPPATPRGNWALRGLLALALVFAVREARPLLAPVVIAIVLTFVLAPGVRWLRRHGVPEVLGALLLVLALLGSTVPLAASLARPAALWWEAAPATVSQLLGQFERLRAAIPGLGPRGGTSLPAPPASADDDDDPVKERLASEGVALTGVLLGHGVAFVVALAATVILLYFLLASEHWMLSRCIEAVPRQRTRALLLGGVRAAQREIGHYLVSVGVLNLGAGIATGLAVWALGLPNPTLWGALAAVLCFVPYIGPLVILGLLLLAGITSFGNGLQMLGPCLAFAVIHAVETNVVAPWFVGRRLSLSPISVFLSVMFWGWLWGIAGALIAVPMLIVLRTLSHRMHSLRLLRRFLDGNRREPPSLRSLLRPALPLRLRLPPLRMRATPPPVAAPRASEAVDVTQARDVDVLPRPDAGETQLAARPLEHHP